MKANPNYIHLKKSIPNNRFTLLQGGTRSGKTFSIIYYFIWLCENYNGLEIDIVRDTFTALKSTVWKDFKQVLLLHGLYQKENHNKTDHIYNLNGNIISYYGADDPAKIHGRSRDILWVNECNQLDEDTIDQLFPRTRYRIVMDYNPAMPTEHWLDSYIDKYPPIITTYKDNPHLTNDQVREIESKRNNKYWWSVYGTGERTTPTGVIFENWIIGEFDESLPYVWGMDFGYVNDPTTLVKVAKKDNKVYCKEYLYQKEMSTEQISILLKQTIETQDTVIADCAEPRLIAELQQNNLRVYPCEKGKDSIRQGIADLQNCQIIVDPTSTNLKLELNNYTWNEKLSNVPVDKYNHLLDALRYAFKELDYPDTYIG